MATFSMRRFFALPLVAIIVQCAGAQDTLAPALPPAPAPLTTGRVYDFGPIIAPPRFEANASLLFLQPGAGNLEYATLVTPLPAPSPNWSNQSVSPNLSPAFRFGLRCIVPDTANDIQLNWTHLTTSDSATVVGLPTQFVGPNYNIGPDASIYHMGTGVARFGYDAINLDAGQYLCSGGGPVQVRAFGGLQYGHIRQNLSSTVSSYNGDSTNNNTTNSLFNGVGPRLGLKGQMFKGKFDFLGEMAGALLVGRMHSRLDFATTDPSLAGLGIPSPNIQSLTSPNSTQIVPSLDTRLGGAYSRSFRNYGIFRFEAGYQAAVYFNAINQYSISDVVVPGNTQAIGLFLRTQDHTQTNFTAHGPYLSASWLF